MKDLHDLHVWFLTSAVKAMSAHVVGNDANSIADLLRSINDQVKNSFKIHHTTIQLDQKDIKARGPFMTMKRE